MKINFNCSESGCCPTLAKDDESRAAALNRNFLSGLVLGAGLRWIGGEGGNASASEREKLSAGHHARSHSRFRLPSVKLEFDLNVMPKNLSRGRVRKVRMQSEQIRAFRARPQLNKLFSPSIFF